MLKISKTIIAVDSGLNGAIVVCSGHRVEIHPMPKFKTIQANGKTFNKTDVDKVNEILSKHQGADFFIEQVQAWGGDMANIGRMMNLQKLFDNYVTLRSVAQTHNMEVHEIRSKDWQSYLGFAKIKDKTERKNMYKTAAQRWYPNHKVTLQSADALCVLRYAIMKKYL